MAIRGMPKRLRALVAGAALSVALASVAGAAPQAPPSPPLVGAIRTGTAWALRPLDPKTLAPVRGGWSVPVGRNPSLTRSPLGTGVIAVWSVGNGGRTIVVDTRSGRIVRRYPSGVGWSTLHWLGPELPLSVRGGPFLVQELGGVCWSQGCGTEYEVVGTEFSEGFAAETVALLRNRIVLSIDADGLTMLGPPVAPITELTPYTVRLAGLPRSAPVRVAADVATGRVYAISSAGTVARIDAASRRPVATYHRVALNGGPFEAVWAGRGQIALWGPDGLGTIDTRTWKTRALAPAATHVVATRHGLAAWVGGRPGGITVYRPDGSVRFRALDGQTVRSAEAAGRYLYVRAAHRYAIDLVSGRVLGRVRADARIARPSIVPLP
jgi:hypothetical protein